MYVNPATTFEAVAKFPTGLTGTLGIRITDNQATTVLPRQTTGITEYPAGSGIYAVTLTSPSTAGQYTLVWDDASDHWADEDLVVTTDIQPGVILGSGNLYITRDQLKTIQDLESTDFEDDAIDIAIAAACRAIDGYTGHRFYQATQTRYFTGDPLYPLVQIDDLLSPSEVAVDQDGDGVYEETWIEGTDFLLDPPNSALDGQPKRTLVIRQSGGFTYPRGNRWFFEAFGRRFPRYDRSIKITGVWGWTAVPAQVTQAAVLIANRFLERTRQAPLGILVASAREISGTARLGRIDPDAAWLLDQIPGGQRRLLI